MPSPFPGMNPYLEQDDVWHDFHEKFLPALAEQLVPQVRPHYIVKLDEHVYVHELPEEDSSPVQDRESSAYLEVRDRHSRELITVISLLSPSNKQAGPDREQYLG